MPSTHKDLQQCQEALTFVKFKDYDKAYRLDSQTVLLWIKTPPREFRACVSVRVAEIQETVGSEQFRPSTTQQMPSLEELRLVTSKAGCQDRRF